MLLPYRKISLSPLASYPPPAAPANQRSRRARRKEKRERESTWLTVGRLVYLSACKASHPLLINPPAPPPPRLDLRSISLPSLILSSDENIIRLCRNSSSFSYSARVEEEGGAASERECTLRKPLHFSVTNDL